MELREWISMQHGAAHTAIDRELAKITDDEHYRARPGGANSVAWLLWHVTRLEDVAVNAMIRGVPQVLVSGGWNNGGTLSDPRMGTGLRDDEVSSFSRAVDLTALHAYRDAVRAQTARWLETVDSAVFDEHPDVDARLDAAGGVLSERAAWIREGWRGWPASSFMSWPAIGHTTMHTGEMQATLQRLGLIGR